MNAYGPRTTFAPGYDGLFKKALTKYGRKCSPVQDHSVARDRAVFKTLREHPLTTGGDLAVLMGVTRNSIYAKLHILYKLEHVDYRFEAYSDRNPIRYKKWFVVEEDMKWTGGAS